MILIDQIVEIAEAIELGDPVDWGMLSINEHEAYLMMAQGVYDHYSKLPKDDTLLVTMLAIVTKLTVENFVLNLRLENRYDEG